MGHSGKLLNAETPEKDDQKACGIGQKTIQSKDCDEIFFNQDVSTYQWKGNEQKFETIFI